MKKDWNTVIILISFICLLILLPVSFVVFAFAIPVQYGQTYLGEMKYKMERLADAEGKRIIIVGGSSVAFGQDSALIEEYLPEYSVVNFGLYGDLGTKIMLDIVEDNIREGDIIIISPEQTKQTLSMYFDGKLFWQTADGNVQILKYLKCDDLGSVVGGFPEYAAKKYYYYLSGTTPNPEDIYRKDSFNEYGDIRPGLRPYNLMNAGHDITRPVSFEEDIMSDDFAAYLNAFNAYALESGAVVYYRLCPINCAAISEGTEKTDIDEYVCHIEQKLDFSFIGDPQNSIMEAGYFYDTNFHLNDAGVVVNTQNIIRELISILYGTNTIEFEIPEIPAPPAQKTSGDNTDADCFVYVPQEKGYYIAGLSEIGARKESLTIPAEYGNMPVLGFAPETFRGNAVLNELIIQSNVDMISDYSFEGCVSLSRLVLLHDEPSQCIPGDNLIGSANFEIYVRSEKLNSFMVSYFWTRYANRIHSYDEDSDNLTDYEASISDKDTANPDENIKSSVTYLLDADGTERKNVEISDAHLRFNTLSASEAFSRSGYIQIGWNTSADGDGTHIGFGSRHDKNQDCVLYPEWAKVSDEALFVVDVNDTAATIVGYSGGDTAELVIPPLVDGCTVTEIATGAFADLNADTIVIPQTVQKIDWGAFVNVNTNKLVIFDNLTHLDNEAYMGGEFRHLYINAARKPAYSGSYFDTFADKYDRLLNLKQENKIILAGGSTVRFGYNSKAIDQKFQEYEVVNMGVFAYSNMLPQYLLILDCVKEGDILFSTPEFDAIDYQFCVNNTIDYAIFAMVESNYDLFAQLDCGMLDNVIPAFSDFLSRRMRMEKKSYDLYVGNYDEHGIPSAVLTYNEYGDYVYPRPNNTAYRTFGEKKAYYNTVYFPPEYLDALNSVYQLYLDKSAIVLFGYAPRSELGLSNDSTMQSILDLDMYLRENLIVPVTGDIKESIMSAFYFYETDNHLSDDGVKIRTQMVIDDIMSYIKMYEIYSNATPQ